MTRIVCAMVFSKLVSGKFQAMSADITGDTFAPGQNPLEPTEPPIATFTGSITAQRITVD